MGESSDDSSLIDRLKSWARAHAFDQNASRVAQRSVLPTINPQQTNVPCAVTTSPHDTKFNNPSGSGPNRDNAIDSISSITPPPAPPESQIDGASSPPVEHEKQEEAPTYRTRLSAGSTRFWRHTVNALCYSWVNVLLIFVPIGIAAEVAHLNPTIIFAVNAVAIVPLAGLLSHATENVASRLGDTLGALLNVSFGNAVELIILYVLIALVKDEIRIVQASLLGSILANLLLILGMAFLLGGLRYREQVYNSTVTQMSACLLSLSVMSLLLPTAFHASFAEEDEANRDTLKISRGTSVVLLLIYVLYLLFQLKSHAYMYESTPQQIIDEESHPGGEHGAAIEDDEHASVMSRTAAVVLLLVSTGLVAVCAEFLVSAIPEMVANSKVSQAFIGLIILPIVGNAAEHVTAVTVAAKNKMDLAIGVAVGSSIQIAIFVTPLVVVLGWCMDKPMSLYFNLFETVSLFVTAFVVNFLVLDGRSNYLEGALLIAAYVIIGVAAFFYPDNNAQSDIGGSNLPGS
ncbi:calcium/proton exchanger [Patellaria atrata CBS 101060]|uniref:Vacuolar calcium ion transporter n=1 Tax=Patellaria atrata CBS 101060 TaxID=1346257 RepID=A0A9P4VTR5_9PEZI|nr:calcium/proton exchanger [Patellaria atrata CBS 101060]